MRSKIERSHKLTRSPIKQQKRTPPNKQGGVGRQQQQEQIV